MSVQVPVVHTTVFAAAPGGGNPCPVCFDTDGLLTTAQMQGLAARFGHETAFVLKPGQPDADLRLRYFVPNHEMEMCIHATVGTITVLVERGSVTASPVRIETPLGIIRAEWSRESGVITVMVEQFPPTFLEITPNPTEVAAALGVPEDLLDRRVLPIQAVSTARAKLLVPLRDYGVLDALQPDFEKLWEVCERYHNTGFYTFTLATRQPDFDVDARQFPLRAGYPEDPATGVAACALAAYLTRYQGGKEGWNGYQIGQGFAMSRPSVIRAEAFVENGAITATRVGGNARILGEETFQVESE
jgi:PhzF family phenazine biosynthesis protein